MAGDTEPPRANPTYWPPTLTWPDFHSLRKHRNRDFAPGLQFPTSANIIFPRLLPIAQTRQVRNKIRRTEPEAPAADLARLGGLRMYRGAGQEPSCALGRHECLLHSDVMGSAKLHLVRKEQLSGAGGRQFRRARKGEKSGSCEQVAAICYRIRKFKIEFLLVRTRKGRWTFPKGGIVPGRTRVQSAALEAFEEAGVHGRIEESSFTTYILRKRQLSKSAVTVLTYAHLCEVARVVPPEEHNRNPTWFSPERARLRLIEHRRWEDAAELTRVVERAVIRIQRLSQGSNRRRDPMQKTQFGASNRGSRRTMAKVIKFDAAAGNVLRERTT